jgi:hypothetical protein
VEGADGLHVCVSTTPGGITFCTDADPIPVDAIERCRDAAFGGPPFDWGHGDCDGDGVFNQDDDEPCTPLAAVDAGVDGGVDAGADAGAGVEDAGRRTPALTSSFNGAGGCRCEVGAPRRTPSPAPMAAAAAVLAALFGRLRRVSSRRAASRCSPPERS